VAAVGYGRMNDSGTLGGCRGIRRRANEARDAASAHCESDRDSASAE